MPANERRFWWCVKGHIMGEIKRVSLRPGGAKVRALMLYETSLESEAAVPDELPPLRGKPIGDMLGIRCTICDRERDWHVGDDALEQLMATRAKAAARV